MRVTRLWLSAVATALALLAGGCSHGGGAASAAATPDELWRLFDDAMKAGKPEVAAELVDYAAQAQSENSDLEASAKSQRTLIAQKMKETTVSGLRGLNYPADGMKAAAPQVQGSRATILATGGGKTLNLVLAQSDKGWRIVGGVPGMTSAAEGGN